MSFAFLTPTLPLGASSLSLSPRSAQRRHKLSSMVLSGQKRTHITALQAGMEDLPSARVRVQIEAPALNKRRITAQNLINAPIEVVWGLLSDYSNLATYIPNLTLSELRRHPTNGIRVEQCGAQSILGFEFRASVTMDMTELNATASDWRAIEFKLAASRDFNIFEGVWRMESVDDKTALFYEVTIVPRGLVPVKAIEWRISEDVPGNMNAVRMECEKRRRTSIAALRRQTVRARNVQ